MIGILNTRNDICPSSFAYTFVARQKIPIFEHINHQKQRPKLICLCETKVGVHARGLPPEKKGEKIGKRGDRALLPPLSRRDRHRPSFFNRVAF